MAWFYLILGGLFEVGFTTALRYVEGFRNLPWTLAFLASVTLSMGLLELSARTIPIRCFRCGCWRRAWHNSIAAPIPCPSSTSA